MKNSEPIWYRKSINVSIIKAGESKGCEIDCHLFEWKVWVDTNESSIPFPQESMIAGIPGIRGAAGGSHKGEKGEIGPKGKKHRHRLFIN